MDPERDLLDELEAKGPKRAMGVFAHPDDAEFSCGGLLALLCKRGWDLTLLVTTSGNKGTKDPTVTPQYLAAEREEEQRAAQRIMGANEPIFLGYPDGYARNDEELRGTLVTWVRRLRPELVITWDGFRPGFNHTDHRETGRAMYDALYPASDDHLYYPLDKEESLEPHRPSAMLLSGTANPNYHVDISSVLRTKARAGVAHASQIGGRTFEQTMTQYRERARAAKEAGEPGPLYRESFTKVIFRRG
jgi:LmbE family N-acetylglucosaminyl deacetylase